MGSTEKRMHPIRLQSHYKGVNSHALYSLSVVALLIKAQNGEKVLRSAYVLLQMPILVLAPPTFSRKILRLSLVVYLNLELVEHQKDAK